MHLLLEAERRVAPKSPIYMAKYILGRAMRDKDGELWGWNENHFEASYLLWWVWETKEDRPAGSMAYLEWTRGARKSTLLQATLVCVMLDEPNETFLWDGDVQKKAENKVYMVKEVFEDAYFQKLFGNLKGEKWRKDELILKRDVKVPEGTLTVSGLDSSKTGKHFKGIFGDDLQTDDNADSAELNEDVKTEIRMFETLQRGKLCPVTWLSGTRWGFVDAGQMLQDMKEEETRRNLPPTIFISRKKGYKINKNGDINWKTAEFPEGGLNIDTLKRMKRNMRPMLFSFNVLLEPYSAEDAPFKKKFIRHHDKSISDQDLQDARYLLIVDPAGDGEYKGADFNALMVVAITPKAELFVMETVNEHLTELELFAEIVRLDDAYPDLDVMVETYFQQYKLLSWLKAEANKSLLQINWVRFKPDKRSKSLRISALEPYFASGKIWWRASHVELEDQAIQWTGREERKRHDDLIDCLAHALQKMSVPLENVPEKWILDENWADRKEYKELEAKGKAPSHSWMMVVAAEERQRQDRAKMASRNGRFSFVGNNINRS